MKKFIGVLVAVMMCAVMCLPCAFAASDSALSELLGGIDLSSLSEGELSSLLGDLDLSNVDLSSLTDQIGALKDTNGGSSAIDDAVANGEANLDEAGDALSSVLGSADMSGLDGLLSKFGVDGSVEDVLGGISSGNSGDFVSTITGVFDDLGLGNMDLSGIDVGSFDISSVLGGLTGGDSTGTDSPTDANPTSDAMAGIADKLLGGLKALGIDTSVIEGLLDNEIVNFFANMYIGFIGKVDETTTAEDTTAAETTKPVPTTEKPIDVKTGDSSSVLVAVATLSVAAAAAFVCMKKKRA